MLTSNKLGFWGLTALVFGLMVGVGIYNLPQNMASVASPGAVVISWMITAMGILPLVFAFKWLSSHYPQYNAGVYQYAQAEFGNFAGFNIAWGYWLSSAFSNVAYGVMLNDSCGAFFPKLLNHGWETVVFVSALIWIMYFIVSRGIKTAKAINTLLALVKIVMLVFIIGVFALFFKARLFEVDIWGNLTGLTGVGTQVKSTMMITLFCFFGIEGAVMMSARAKRSSDIGRAGLAGFLISLVLYVSVTLLCFGLMGRAQLSGLKDPSIAYLLKDTVGDWAYWFVIYAVIISLIGGWLAWTLIVAQVPYEASVVGIMPRKFQRLNSDRMPTYGLFASSVVMELFLFMVVMADNVYLESLRVTGLMIIPCYLFTGLFLFKKANTKSTHALAVVIILFCLWMAYAGGLKEMLMTSLFYMPGIVFYIKARKENSRGKPLFTIPELCFLCFMLLCSVVTVVLFIRYLS